jgi:hypothetical protein
VTGRTDRRTGVRSIRLPMADDEPDLRTWHQRREAELELWADEHLAALAELGARDLRDPAVLRAIATRAEELASISRRLGQLRGDDLRADLLASAFRLQLKDL